MIPSALSPPHEPITLRFCLLELSYRIAELERASWDWVPFRRGSGKQLGEHSISKSWFSKLLKIADLWKHHDTRRHAVSLGWSLRASDAVVG